VATNDPAIPSNVVRMNPDGSFDDPGWRNLAMMPAIKPIIISHRMLNLRSVS
jgi:hypothetical protein